MNAHMRTIEHRDEHHVVEAIPAPQKTVCEVCGKSFHPKRPARACSGRCRAIASRERRRLDVLERIKRGEEALRFATDAMSALRALVEGSPEGMLTIPVPGTRR